MFLSVCGSQRLSRDELRCQYRGKGGQKEGTTQRRENSPSQLALGAGEGTCSPLRVGEWLLPHSMAMYKENWGQIVHWVLVNPRKPWGLSGVRGGDEGENAASPIGMMSAPPTDGLGVGNGMAVQLGLPQGQADRGHHRRPRGS